MLRTRILLASILLSTPALATDWNVHPGSSIQAAINLAHNGDHIFVHAGTYVGVLDFRGKQIEVVGVDGAASTILDASNIPISAVQFVSGETSATLMRGFTIRPNASSQLGSAAGIYVVGSACTIRDCIVTGATGSSGTGFYAAGTFNVVLRDCSFSNCSGEILTTSSGTILLQNVSVDTSTSGSRRMDFTSTAVSATGLTCGPGSPALYLGGGSLSLDASHFQGCGITGGQNGGGIFCTSCSAVSIRHTDFDGCRGYFGGAVRCDSSPLVTIEDSTLSNNALLGTCGYQGAAIWLSNNDSRVTRCLFSGNNGNSTCNQATAVWNSGGHFEVSSCRFTRETTSTSVLSSNGTNNVAVVNCVFDSNQNCNRVMDFQGTCAQVTNCTIAYNQLSWDVDYYGQYRNCIFWGNTTSQGSHCGITYSDSQFSPGGTGNISANPFFFDPGHGDFSLMPGSPCIDAGDPNSPLDADGTRADMGALLAVGAPDCNHNGIPDGAEIPSHDCDNDLILDACELAGHDCNGNQVLDGCEIASGAEHDCDHDGVPDSCEVDCNGNGIPDVCDLASGTSIDLNQDGVPDECKPDCNHNEMPDFIEIAYGLVPDCNGNGVPDSCDIAVHPAWDCDGNGVPDACQISAAPALDCDHDGMLDSCQLALHDCNGNGIVDACDIASGTSIDLNHDGVPDECKPDCNTNGVPDAIDIAVGYSADCNGNAVPDECDIAGGASADCNHNGISDLCEIASGAAQDCNGNQQPDACDIAAGLVPDCNGNGVPDACDLAAGVPDCNHNGVPDSCDIASGTSLDCNHNGIPDSCDLSVGIPDCNHNGIPDSCDIAGGFSTDCNLNAVPDSCELAAGTAHDCNGNGVLDVCDIASGTAQDCNHNGVPDSCDIAAGTSLDCNHNGVPDACDLAAGVPDCNGNGIPDACDIAAGIPDCNGNGVPDACDLSAGGPDCDHNGVLDSCDLAAGAPDCNGNHVPDGCDLAAGEADCNHDQIPDACQIAAGSVPDCNHNGVPDSCDIASGLATDCNANSIPDSCDIAAGAPDLNGNGVLDVCECGASNYCVPLPNSTGQPALMGSAGIPSLLVNDFTLTCAQLPTPSTTGLFFFGPAQLLPGVPFGNGRRCVNGPILRLPAIVTTTGSVSQHQDFSWLQYQQLQVGQVRYFQFWYRDPQAGGANYNASDGLRVTFCY